MFSWNNFYRLSESEMKTLSHVPQKNRRDNPFVCCLRCCTLFKDKHARHSSRAGGLESYKFVPPQPLLDSVIPGLTGTDVEMQKFYDPNLIPPSECNHSIFKEQDSATMFPLQAPYQSIPKDAIPSSSPSLKTSLYLVLDNKLGVS